ncbi:MAG TPA: 16S rRNA (uracil(1498)-N(3))-methyltransferase, partial [Actinomycetes bacterium]|nr:16S rRNA (uracil(1498)-N(3))-methyltransferase [Actinomycetes bacterium]
MSAPVFVVAAERLVVGRVVVDGAEGRHAATVTRLAPGEAVVLTDALGRRASGVVIDAERDVLSVDVTSVVDLPAPQPRFVVVQALPKGDRGELAVETMTEVGVDVVVPWAAARCVTRWRDARGQKALSRWRTSGHSAAKQSRRAWFPEIAELATTAEVAELLSAAAVGVVLHESATAPLATVELPAAGDVVLVVGPEGGVSDDELSAFREAGAPPYRLGETVLRTSTAGTVALAVLSATSRWA